MRLAFIAALVFILAGCDGPNPFSVKTYRGTVSVEKVNGEVTKVTVLFPNQNQNQTLSVYNRKDLDQLVEALKSMTDDLEHARDQMKVIEPPVAQPPTVNSIKK